MSFVACPISLNPRPPVPLCPLPCFCSCSLSSSCYCTIIIYIISFHFIIQQDQRLRATNIKYSTKTFKKTTAGLKESTRFSKLMMCQPKTGKFPIQELYLKKHHALISRELNLIRQAETKIDLTCSDF